MSGTKPLQRLRECGHAEKFSVANHYLGFYNNVGVSVTYSHPGCSIPLESLIYNALRKVIEEHPILSAIPVDEHTKSPYYSRLPLIDLRSCVLIVERANALSGVSSCDKELDAILSERHNQGFKQEHGARPFWSLIILHSPECSNHFTASFIYHHALADGKSGLVFHQSFLDALQNLDRTHPESQPRLNADPIVPSPSTPLLPPLEELHPLPLTFTYVAKLLWRGLFPESDAGLWLGNARPTIDIDRSSPDTSLVPPMHHRSLVLSKEVTARLADLGRKNNATMTATLQCLIAAAVFANLDEKQWYRLRAAGDISLRRFLRLDSRYGPVERLMGVWASQYFFEHRRRRRAESTADAELELRSKSEILQYFSWSEARSVKAEIAKEVAKNLKNNPVNLLRWVPDMIGAGLMQMGKKRRESFELSNLGILRPFKASDDDQDAENRQWSMGRCVFSQSVPAMGPAFMISAVTGGDGCAVFCFGWREGAADSDWLAAVMASFEEAAKALALS
ncbi:uncharacterized protein EI97DRAFT_441303 [Westerdykella ornata]|uniref:Alcohol acetyltransferase n=1 Tax=Westerdykella ornata TaxID=318751 RepID=A0A6A6JSR8_WESOR|nr:uncharacterized protein EI97DRAFT_441303 [Westerdykella ornata]KAF2278029.1 hypothetical protein EI97DRAFT_441303 [Westerdykella ornata]